MERKLNNSETQFKQAFLPYVRLVDDVLESRLPRREDFSAPVVEAMRYSLLAPAKRVRPVLTLVSTERTRLAGASRL